MAHAIVRTDNMAGTDVRSELVSIEYINSSTPTAIDNGNVLLAGGLMTGEREILTGSAVAANSPLSQVVLVASPEVMYNKYALEDFVNPAGMPARGYRLHSGDIFSVTIEALVNGLSDNALPSAGTVIELAAGTKLKAVASLTSGSTKVGEVIAVDTVGKYTFYVIRVA